MLSINAVKGFEYGSGFKGVEMFGSEHNDEFEVKKIRYLQKVTIQVVSKEGSVMVKTSTSMWLLSLCLQ